jgi:phage terminase large subunit-like protein
LTRSYLQQLPQTRQEQFLQSLTPEEKAVLLYDWLFFARDKQLPPEGAWTVWLILSGRGFGKTRTGAQWIRARQETGLYSRFLLIGQTAADVRDVMVEGESGILASSPPWNYPKYEPSKRRLTWPNGATATTFSGDEPDQLRGPQGDSVWADEPAKWKYAQEAWDNLEMGLRLGVNPQVVATTTPRPIPLIRSLMADERSEKNPNGRTVVTRGHTSENRDNLAEVFVNRVIKRYEGTRLGRQELAGEILDDNPNALWQRQEMIEAHRVTHAPDLMRVVVGVDPQVADPSQTSDEQSAETGIVVAGITADKIPHFYVLDDKSLRASPNEWAREVVTAYKRNKADRVIGETNNGGALIEANIRTVDKNISYSAVHASRGKQIRAEPVAALYEQGRVHHVGSFPDLEDQMVQWQPGEKSPDRMDALVWAITELMEKDPKKQYTVTMA